LAVTKNKKLNEQQKEFVTHYCDAENNNTFLNHYEAYKEAGYSKEGSSATKARNLLNKPYIKEAIKKAMPEVAYNSYMLRKEYWDLFTDAKNDGNFGVAAKLLDSMAKTERMFDTTVTDDGSASIKAKRDAEKAAIDTVKRLQKKKEAENKNNLIEMNKKNVAANG
jgi:phage terminase small subunit